MDIVGTFVLILIMALATMGGIGGGGAVVPFTMMFFGFCPIFGYLGIFFGIYLSRLQPGLNGQENQKLG